jgi:hypothetical protein
MSTFEFIPTLTVLRELYEMPRDMARFNRYLERMLGEDVEGKRDVAVPITAANPMGKPHCLDAVNALLAVDAEAIAQQTLAEPKLVPFAPLRVYLSLQDDRAGGWTNRTFNEFKMRYGDSHALRANVLRRLSAIACWTSETYTPERVAWMTRDAVFRTAHFLTHGHARSLRAMLALDRACAEFAGGHDAPALQVDDLRYTHEVLTALLDAEDQPTCIAALFGDDAAREAGYAPLGVSPRAGQALAVSQLSI